MTDTTKAQILEVARKAIHTEMLSLKRMEDTLGDEFATAVEMILGSRGKCIVTGMGKSGLVGRKIAATLASTGTPSFFLHPGEAFHGDLGMISKEDIVVALSYSGETDEILKIVPFIHSNGNKLVSMTGNPDSALAKNSDVHLDVGVKEEACILHLAPTSSTTAQIATGDALDTELFVRGNPVRIRFDAGCDKLREVVIGQGWEHHYALSYGDIVPELLDICRILDIEPAVVQ